MTTATSVELTKKAADPITLTAAAVAKVAELIAAEGTDEVLALRVAVKPGDALFVPAGTEHRFEAMSLDFGAWMIFYGPEGGEPP